MIHFLKCSLNDILELRLLQSRIIFQNWKRNYMHPVHNQKTNHRFWSVCNQLICLSVKILSKQNRLISYLPVAFFEILRSHNFRHLKKQNMIRKFQCQCHKLSKFHHQNSLNQKFILWYDYNCQNVCFWSNKTCGENRHVCSQLIFCRFFRMVDFGPISNFI